jgi:hypothetical protein
VENTLTSSSKVSKLQNRPHKTKQYCVISNKRNLRSSPRSWSICLQQGSSYKFYELEIIDPTCCCCCCFKERNGLLQCKSAFIGAVRPPVPHRTAPQRNDDDDDDNNDKGCVPSPPPPSTVRRPPPLSVAGKDPSLSILYTATVLSYLIFFTFFSFSYFFFFS